MRLWGINIEFVGFIPPEPRDSVYFVRLNFNTSKLVNLAKLKFVVFCLWRDCKM